MSDNVLHFPGVGATEQEPYLDAAVEALLFAAGTPVKVEELERVIIGVEGLQIRESLHRLSQKYLGHGIQLVVVSGAWQLRTDPRFAELVLRFRQGKPATMSSAALETLSVVAYQQPVTRLEVDKQRGVSSGGVLKKLLDKGFVRTVGRRDEPGRPLEYGTTPQFLEAFSLPGVGALPTLRDRAELTGEPPPDGVVGDSEAQAFPESEPPPD